MNWHCVHTDGENAAKGMSKEAAENKARLRNTWFGEGHFAVQLFDPSILQPLAYATGRFTCDPADATIIIAEAVALIKELREG